MDPQLLAAVLATISVTAAGGSIVQLLLKRSYERKKGGNAAEMAGRDFDRSTPAVSASMVDSLLGVSARQGWSAEHAKRLFEAAITDMSSDRPAERSGELTATDWEALDKRL